MVEITRCKNNWELEHICEQQWNEIEYLKQENEELKKDIAELSESLHNLKILFYLDK
jgi:cell division protein FtsB